MVVEALDAVITNRAVGSPWRAEDVARDAESQPVVDSKMSLPVEYLVAFEATVLAKLDVSTRDDSRVH